MKSLGQKLIIIRPSTGINRECQSILRQSLINFVILTIHSAFIENPDPKQILLRQN